MIKRYPLYSGSAVALTLLFGAICASQSHAKSSVQAIVKNYDVYEPSGLTGAQKAPVLLFIHGGAWQSGSKSEYASIARTFAKKGLCSVAIDYRLSSIAKHPAPVEDLKAIIEALKPESLKTETASLSTLTSKCDFSRIYLVGHSAGAHMLAFWNSKYVSDRVRGFVGIEGIYDIPDLITAWPDYKDGFIAKEFGDEKLWNTASPTRLKMKSKAPWLIFHSKKDELVDVKQSENFVAALKKQSLAVDFVLLENSTHFGAVQELELPDSTITKKLLQFVK